MRLTSRTPDLAEHYRPSSERERHVELTIRNVSRLVDYYGRSAHHTITQEEQRAALRDNRRQALRRAFLARRATAPAR